ncbi:SIMPL domain-containing protein [Desulfonatronum parangueonense]
MSDSPFKLFLAALLIAVGLTLCGYFIGQGFIEGRLNDRFVTVRGLAETEVQANLAIWPLRFVATGDNLSEVHAQLRSDAEKVVQFFARHGLPENAIELQSLEVTDLMAQAYRSGPMDSRFILTQILVARTENVDLIASASQRVSELVEAGVVLSAEYGSGGPVYLFTGLNDVKPAMIAEATVNARLAAEQFAADAGSRLGGIRRATQGLFQILPRDNAPNTMEHKQINKTLRVVTTVEYYLTE